MTAWQVFFSGSRPGRHRPCGWILAVFLFALAAACPAPTHAATKTSASEPVTQVYFIRGFLGIFSTGFDSMAKDLAKRGIVAETYGHLSTSAIRARIVSQYATTGKRKRRPIILVGHSFGGNAAFQVASQLNKDGIPVALVITVDPTRAGPLSENVKSYVNYFFPGNGLGAELKAKSGVPQSRIKNTDMRKRTDVAGAGDDHWTVTHNAAIQSEIMKAVKRAAR